ncbi:thioredoxin domain-containing protein [Candidatus Woesearchaeota archaeon]|nr:thioredoxin domain-containing protein [Candidatus Woesearchaeota archaeon]
MEQKQLDDLEETYFGEEFIDDEEEVRVEDLKEKKKPITNVKPVSPPTPVVLPKKTTSKTVSLKSESRATASAASLPQDEEGYVDLQDRSKVEHRETEKVAKVEVKPKRVVETAPSTNPWSGESKTSSESKSSSFGWKIVAGILLILLVASILTAGFRGMNPTSTENDLTLTQAQEKVLDYVNTNLLEAPFVAQVENAADEGNVYRVTLSVAGQNVDSYITKDGEIFFPQGFKTSVAPDVDKAQEPSLANIDITGQPIKGNTNAPVTIVEFSDFECPFCGKFFEETYPQLEKEYIKTGKVKLVFMDFPLSFHPQAQPAALAAACANEQGKFWEYHDLLFKNQELLSAENYQKWATDLELDATKFKTCVDSQKYLKEVQKDLTDGQEYGVSGTPAFFINGKLLSGAQPFTAFKAEIDAQLAIAQPTSVQPTQPSQEAPSQEAPVAPSVPVAPVAQQQPSAQDSDPSTQTQSVALSSKKWSFSPTTIRVKEGAKVLLTITPNDSEPTFSLPSYSFSIPALGVNTPIAGKTVVEFRASKKGTFEFSCSSCPEQRNMKGTLVVE